MIVALAVLAALLLIGTVGIWLVLKLVGRATGLDKRVDRFLDGHEGQLDPADKLEFQEQHRQHDNERPL